VPCVGFAWGDRDREGKRHFPASAWGCGIRAGWGPAGSAQDAAKGAEERVNDSEKGAEDVHDKTGSHDAEFLYLQHN